MPVSVSEGSPQCKRRPFLCSVRSGGNAHILSSFVCGGCMLSLEAMWRAFVCGGILPSESEFPFFLPVVVGLLRLRTETLASICSGVYCRLARYGFFPSRNGCSGHPVAVHIFISFGLPQQQSKHLSRITFTGFVTCFSTWKPPFSVIAVSPYCHRCPCVCRC